MLFAQTAAPTGWTKSTAHDNKALRVVSGTASSGGSVAFTTAFASQTPAGSVSTSISALSGSVSTSITGVSGSVGVSGTVGATTLTESQMPSHRHSTSPYTPGGAAAYLASGYNSFFDGGSGVSGYTGGNGSHDHSFSGSGSFTFSSGSASSSFTFSSGTASSSFSGTAINLAVQYVDVIIATKD